MDVITHYQKSIEKSQNDPKRVKIKTEILKYFQKTIMNLLAFTLS